MLQINLKYYSCLEDKVIESENISEFIEKEKKQFKIIEKCIIDKNNNEQELSNFEKRFLNLIFDGSDYAYFTMNDKITLLRAKNEDSFNEGLFDYCVHLLLANYNNEVSYESHDEKETLREVNENIIEISKDYLAELFRHSSELSVSNKFITNEIKKLEAFISKAKSIEFE